MKANAWFAHAIYSVEILVDYTAIQVYRRSRTRRGYAQSNYGRKAVDPGRNIFPADCGDRGWSDRQYRFPRGRRYALRRRAGLSRRNARSLLFRRAFNPARTPLCPPETCRIIPAQRSFPPISTCIFTAAAARMRWKVHVNHSRLLGCFLRATEWDRTWRRQSQLPSIRRFARCVDWRN